MTRGVCLIPVTRPAKARIAEMTAQRHGWDVITLKDEGVGVAEVRNRLFEMSEGYDVVRYVDDDDFVTGFRPEDMAGRPLVYFNFAVEVQGVTYHTGRTGNPIRDGVSLGPWAWAATRSALLPFAFPLWDKTMVPHEGAWLWLRFLKAGLTPAFDRTYGYTWRRGETGLSSDSESMAKARERLMAAYTQQFGWRFQ